MIDGNGGKGVNRYQGFGLRVEWLRRWLDLGSGWAEDSPLGNRQVEGFGRWLQDAGLAGNDGRSLTAFGAQIRGARPRADDLGLWHLIWTRLSYGSPVAAWYAYRLPPGRYPKPELSRLLALWHGSIAPNRTHVNAVNALVNTFERSPLGDLGIGTVDRGARPTTITKGTPQRPVPSFALLHAISLLVAGGAERTEWFVGDLLSSHERSPCRLFGLSDEAMIERCRELPIDCPGLVRCDGDGPRAQIALADGVTSSGIIGRWFPATE